MQNSKRTNNKRDDKDNKFKSTTTADYHGLCNEGATCYLNSVLQVLFMTEDFREAVESNTEEKYTVDVQLKRLFTALKESETNTKDVLSILGITNLHEQCDAAEYFERILSMVHSDASKIFKGELRHSTTCFSKHVTSNETGPFWILPLPIADPLDSSNTYCVKDGFNDFFKSSTVSGENQMYCEECDKKADATIECRMEHHPDILSLLLKRFEFDYYSMAYVKINRDVEVPHALQTQDCDYELYAVVDHVGSLRCGHYTATIKSHEDHNWYVFDDTCVQLLNSNTFQQDRFKSQIAYLLIYRKLVTPDCQINHGTDNRRPLIDSPPPFTPSCSFEMETNRRKEEDKNVQLNETINQVNLVGGTEDAQKEDDVNGLKEQIGQIDVIGLKEQKGQIYIIGLKEQKSDNDGFGQNKQKEQTKIEYWSGDNKVDVNVKESDDKNGLEEQKEESEVVGQKDQEGDNNIVRQDEQKGLKDVRQEQQKEDVRQDAQKENKVLGEKEQKGENYIVRQEGNKEEYEVVGQMDQEGEDDDVELKEQKEDKVDTQKTQNEYDVLGKNTQTNKEHFFVVTQEQQNVDKRVRQKEPKTCLKNKKDGEFVTQKKQRGQEKIRQDGNKINYNVIKSELEENYNSRQNRDNVLENKTENDVVKRGKDVFVCKHNDERKRNVDGTAKADRIKGDPEDNRMEVTGRATLARGNSGVAVLGGDFDMTESDRTGNTSPSTMTDTPGYTTQCCFSIQRKREKKTAKAENKSGQWLKFLRWKVKKRLWRLIIKRKKVNKEKRLMENINKEDTKNFIEMGKREDKKNKKKKVEVAGTEKNKGSRRKRVDSKSPFLTI